MFSQANPALETSGLRNPHDQARAVSSELGSLGSGNKPEPDPEHEPERLTISRPQAPKAPRVEQELTAAVAPIQTLRSSERISILSALQNSLVRRLSVVCGASFGTFGSRGIDIRC